MTALNPATTPVATSKTAALSRVLDAVTKGYVYSVSGTCPAEKALRLARKFHVRYGIGCSPAQRITRKKKGLANAILVLYWPAAKEIDLTARMDAVLPAQSSAQIATSEIPPGHLVSWLLLATEGAGPVHEEERLRSVLESPRRVFLAYELVRHTARDRVRWTFRRTKPEMIELYALLGEQLNRRQMSAVEQTLLRISRQPGFAGVREQSFALCQFARSRGYAGELPFLHFVQKTSHGVPLVLSSPASRASSDVSRAAIPSRV